MADALTSFKSKHPHLGDHVSVLANLSTQKLTHQITVAVVKVVDEASRTHVPGGHLVEFFNEFVASYAERMNPVELVRILAKCVLPPDVDVATGLSLIEKYTHQASHSKNAALLMKILSAELHMKKTGNLSQARTLIDSICESLVDPIYAHSIDAAIRGSFHLVASDLYLSLGNDLEFYNHLLKFLTYTPLPDIPHETLSRTTKQAGIIALINPQINDFGELLSLPAFSDVAVTSGHGAPCWLVDFLRSIHLGDFDAFETALKTHQAELAKEYELMSKIDSSLRRKLTMIALAELAGFICPEKNRRLTFQQISDHCRIPVTEVEELVMTTMGVGKLIEGIIDEVNEHVVVTTVKPRILDTQRVLILKARIESWAQRASELSDKLVELTPELLVS